ncbi:DUF4269 domain-containing protein [Marinifilum sp. N1E240]|uniref:DUF4269 domain-containing protein n=1 Tax=Marinifilum sp. N1E240 TaxID=2608082 RepID=UPI00128C2506|nr:DUF4269 domain-containing protein [Marinifilum sp. N1E240]MPQ45832.1 DUF4269 domain-containing protein [Marinifilum sp. N1E240]
MKIYFSGSIRGGQQDAELYQEIITDLKQYGTVLTEHIGNKIQDSSLNDEEIHNRDVEWLEESDVVVAEVTTTSLGVGYEIGRAVEMKKPIVCLYRTEFGKNVSAMIRGCAQLKCFKYSTLDEAKTILKKHFNAINMNWRDFSYLKNGTPTQLEAYKCLNKLHIFDSLHEYNPTLTGTIPIDIAIDSSDLDIVCYYMDADRFESRVESLFGKQKGFTIEQKEKDGYWVVVARFKFQNFDIEIYGSLFPVISQNSYRHMLIEDRVLKLLGEEFKQQVIQLKKDGLKTEPAFAQLLQLSGNPYVELLKLELYSDNKIKEMWELNPNQA